MWWPPNISEQTNVLFSDFILHCIYEWGIVLCFKLSVSWFSPLLVYLRFEGTTHSKLIPFVSLQLELPNMMMDFHLLWFTSAHSVLQKPFKFLPSRLSRWAGLSWSCRMSGHGSTLKIIWAWRFVSQRWTEVWVEPLLTLVLKQE